MDTPVTTGTTTTAPARFRPATRVKVGLGIAIFLGLTNLPGAFQPTPDGQDGPPLGVLVLGTVLGLISIIAAVIAWRSGNRVALRVTAACVILNVLSALPAFFVDVPAFIKLLVAVSTLVALLAVVLMFSRPSARPADGLS